MSLHEFYRHIIATSRNVLQEDSSDHELKEAQVGWTKNTLDPISDVGKRLCYIYLGVYVLIWNCTVCVCLLSAVPD